MMTQIKKLIRMYIPTASEQRGSTLLEMMIAVSLFALVVVTGMGALISANVAHNKARDLRAVIDSLNFAMEDMSRNIRTGYNYRCLTGADSLIVNISVPKSCATGWGVAFEAGVGDPTLSTDQWVYYIDSNGRLQKSADGGSTFIAITPAQVVISSVSSLAVLGALTPSAGDEQQPLATIRLVGTITFGTVVTPFSLQTSASQRLLDI